MIVRILADNQYCIDDGNVSARKEIGRLDDELFEALAANDDGLFQDTLARLITTVRQVGTIVPVEELVASDVIVPAEDMTATETRATLHMAAVS